jgi:aryl-alcohol dehydrogenase-like predicted oxidoreductase
MLTRTLGRTDLEVSVVGLGTMSWPGCHFSTEGHPSSEEDYRAIRAMVAAALEAGVTLFDTAEGYGRGLAERQLGRALEELGARERSVVVTKVGPLFGEEKKEGRNCNLSKRHILERCEGSLRRLRTGCIDLYLAHWPDPQTPVAETMEAMDLLKTQGKIRWFGVSNFSVPLMAEALACGVVAANQLPYSLVDRSIDADRLPFCREQGIGIMAYSPLGKGVVSGKYDPEHLPPPEDYRRGKPHFAEEKLPHNLAVAQRLRELAPEAGCSPAQLALAWVLAQPGLTVALPGAKSPEQVRGNAAAGGLAVPPGILEELGALSAP